MRYLKGGGGYGRTLARAWSSQSRRSRVFGIRLPREERKAMVESFVKQYQQSNNGKFPSITLTKLEVGGSYPVVRHILQEVKFVWRRDQVPKPGLAEQCPRESRQLDIENAREIDGDSVTVERLNSDLAEVAGVSEVRQPAGMVLEAHRLEGDVDSVRANAGDVQTSGSLEQNEHAKEVLEVVVDTPSLEMNDSAKLSLVEGQASRGSMGVEEIVEVKTSEVKVIPEGNVAVDTSHSQPVLTGEREELDRRIQVSSPDKDRTIEQSYSGSEKEVVDYQNSLACKLPREKRKAMVESFVKQYQESNNRKFPSIKLTRQAVGGSYLVVRHILQEVKFVWSRDQVPKPGPAEQFPQGIVSTEPQPSSGTLSLNGTASMADEQHSKSEEAHRPVSDVLGAESKQLGIENLREIDGDSVSVERLNSDLAEVVGVKQPAGMVLEAYRLEGDVDSDRANADDVQTSGSLEHNEHAKEVLDVVVDTLSLEMNDSAKQSLVEGQASRGSMGVEEIVEVKTSEVKVTPKGNVAVDPSHSQPVLTGEREELDRRIQVSSPHKDRTLEQSYSRSEKEMVDYQNSLPCKVPREERKALVESFVKQYQESNNGKFPSIKLTRQAVGGSYPVVCHILQEVKFVWSRDQVPKPGPAEQFPQGIISTEPQPSSGTLSSNGTASMADEQHSKSVEAHRPVSDVLGAESKQLDIENLQEIDGDSVTVERLNSGGVQATGSEVNKKPAGMVLEAYRLEGDVDYSRANAPEVQTSGSLEQNEHTTEVLNVFVDTPSLEMNESAKQSLVEGKATRGPMSVEEIVEVRTSDVKVTPKGNVAVETPHLQAVPIDEKAELDTRNQVSSTDKDRTLEQSYSRSEKVEMIIDDTSVNAGGVHQSDLRADIPNNVGSKDERALAAPLERETKTIGAALKSFLVTAFRKFWPG
ncbi:unnamed protein product [Linum trigynum]|uniref:AT3G52170-like helix-turn-helix domain-containing protein n=1 Tax=Linum trigynum TaxID=586398 RepID=A0AAV2ELW6_9ROSI